MTTLVLLKASLRYDNNHNNNDIVVIIAAGKRQRGNEGKRGAQTTEMTMTETMMTDMTMTTRQRQ